MNSHVTVIDQHEDAASPQPDTVELPRELVQQIIDYLARCPAGDVYPILRALEGR